MWVLFVVGPGKVATRDERDCKCLEEPRRDGREGRCDVVSRVWIGLERNSLSPAAVIPCRNWNAGDCRGAHGRQTGNGFGKLSAIAAHLNARETLREWCEMDLGHPNLLESRIEGLEALQRSQKESCSLQQDQRNSDLRDDQRSAENSCAAAESALALPQCRRRMLARELPRRDQTDEESREHSRGCGKAKDAPVRPDVEQDRNRLIMRHQRNQKLAAPMRERQRKQGACAGEKERFNDKQANSLPWTGSQRDPCTDLLTTIAGSGEGKAGQINADHQQNERDDAEQQVKRPLNLGAEFTIEPSVGSCSGRIERKSHRKERLPSL